MADRDRLRKLAQMVLEAHGHAGEAKSLMGDVAPELRATQAGHVKDLAIIIGRLRQVTEDLLQLFLTLDEAAGPTPSDQQDQPS